MENNRSSWRPSEEKFVNAKSVVIISQYALKFTDLYSIRPNGAQSTVSGTWFRYKLRHSGSRKTEKKKLDKRK